MDAEGDFGAFYEVYAVAFGELVVGNIGLPAGGAIWLEEGIDGAGIAGIVHFEFFFIGNGLHVCNATDTVGNGYGFTAPAGETGIAQHLLRNAGGQDVAENDLHEFVGNAGFEAVFGGAVIAEPVTDLAETKRIGVLVVGCVGVAAPKGCGIDEKQVQRTLTAPTDEIANLHTVIVVEYCLGDVNIVGYLYANAGGIAGKIGGEEIE